MTTLSVQPELELLTVKGVAKILRCSTRTVYRMIDAKEIPSLTVGGMKRFRSEAIFEWIEAGCPKEPSATQAKAKSAR